MAANPILTTGNFRASEGIPLIEVRTQQIAQNSLKSEESAAPKAGFCNTVVNYGSATGVSELRGMGKTYFVYITSNK